MKVATWNVNSIRTRKERVIEFLKRHDVDVLCLQETKVDDATFPLEDIEALGYRVSLHGQKGGYNGVAILSKKTPDAIEKGFDGNPIPEQARVISARFNDLTIICVYVVNGQSLDSPKYELKLDWLDIFNRWIANQFNSEQKLIVTGDFNIAPSIEDTHNPKRWEGNLLCSLAERNRLQALVKWGMRDLALEKTTERSYTWWDYRFGSFKRNSGLRIDLVLASDPMVAVFEGIFVDKEERSPEYHSTKPSDHAPVIALFR